LRRPAGGATFGRFAGLTILGVVSSPAIARTEDAKDAGTFRADDGA
jgi:hypothetical protein